MREERGREGKSKREGGRLGVDNGWREQYGRGEMSERERREGENSQVRGNNILV